MIVCLLKNNYISSIELPNKIQGQYWLKDEGDEDVIAIEGVGTNWIVQANKNALFLDGAKSIVLENDIIYRLKDKDGQPIYIYVEKEYKNTYFLKYKLNSENIVITVGRNESNTICIKNNAVSSSHLKLFYKNKKWFIQDNKSTNGTFVNNKRVNEGELNIGDVVYVLGTKIIIGNDFLSINKNEITIINENVLRLMKFLWIESDLDSEEIETEYFYRSPRVKKDIQSKQLDIDSPPENQIGEEIPFMMIVGPSITMGMASLATALFAISNAISNGNITAALPSVIMSVSMLLGTVMWPILSKRYEKKKKSEKESLRQEKYTHYLERKEHEIKECAKEQARIWNENFPSIEECANRIDQCDYRLFERNINHNDFLDLRVGLGKRRVDINIRYSKKGFTLIEDNLKDRLENIGKSEKVIDNIPVTISLLKQYLLGIVGEKNITDRLLNNMLVQLLSFYGYDDVKLVLIYDEKNSEYDCFKWLLHVFDDKKENRFIARNSQELKELSMYFEPIINERKKLNDNDILPYYIVISFDRKLGDKANFIKAISKIKKNIHFSIIHVCESIQKLPNDCKTVIEVNGRSGSFYDLEDMTGTKTFFIPDQSKNDMNSICKKLANISLDLTDTEVMLPDLLTFLQMYNVGKVEHLNALTRWKENDPTASLQVPIGVDKFGELFNLDLHQKYHGPHGLVAGMTGSGKSEFIMTYILSLAVNYHPNEVAFVLIDYKGGGMAKAFEKLPHTAGIITNLDGSSVKRSLISIQSELQRRQSIFAEVSKQQNVSNMDIYKYQELYRKRNVNEPLQHLFIISDEFAELKAQQPDFMEQLISAARIGRSLGVHLILATQKPSGVVDDQIWSNSRFRICLKVQDRSDSMDMLKRPDAAEISQTGRFYLQVGYNELFEMGQSAWAGASYYPTDKPIIERNDSVDMIDISGHYIERGKLNRQRNMSNDSNKQLDEVTQYLRRIAEDENISIRKLWLEPLSEISYLDEYEYKYNLPIKKDYIINPVIGEYDDPYHQSQGIVTLPISKNGNTIVYGISGSGKTTFLTTLLYSIISQYSSDEINLYIMDFASETLKAYQEAPQIGDVVLSYEEEKIKNLFKLLIDELKTRKKLFSNFGGDIINYNINSITKSHSIVTIIHNYTAFSEIYDELEDEIAYLTREGSKYGLYFIFTTMNSNGVRMKIQQNFAQNITLQMVDESDYSFIMGNNNGMIPQNKLGRGLVKIEDNVYEFQTAKIPRKIKVYNDIVNYCLDLKKSTQTIAKPIPILPDVVGLDLLRPYMNSRRGLPIGINCNSLEVEYLDYKKNYINYIVVENTDYQRNINAFIELLDKSNLMRVTLENSGEVIDEIFDMLVYRNNTYKESSDIQETIRTFDSKIIFIEQLEQLIEELDDERTEKLELILDRGKSNYQINVIIVENSQNIAKQSHTSWFKKGVSNNDVIWLGNGINNQYIFSVANNKSLELKKDCVIYVKDKKLCIVKMISKENELDEKDIS